MIIVPHHITPAFPPAIMILYDLIVDEKRHPCLIGHRTHRSTSGLGGFREGAEAGNPRRLISRYVSRRRTIRLSRSLPTSSTEKDTHSCGLPGSDRKTIHIALTLPRGRVKLWLGRRRFMMLWRGWRRCV